MAGHRAYASTVTAVRRLCGRGLLARVRLGACGGDDEGRRAGHRRLAATPTGTGRPRRRPSATETAGDRRRGPPGGAGAPSPRGAGGRRGRRGARRSSQALFTGRGGRLTPRVVRVPPFIAIRVELRSADGATYAPLGQDGRAERDVARPRPLRRPAAAASALVAPHRTASDEAHRRARSMGRACAVLASLASQASLTRGGRDRR